MNKKPILLAVLATMLAGLAPAVAAQSDGAEPFPVELKLSEDMLERGVHGTVMLAIEADQTGKVTQAAVSETSGSEELDQWAVERLSTAQIGADVLTEDGKLTLEINAYAYAIGMGITRSYSCLQAVRDHDWYVGNNPEETIERGKFFHMTTGLALLSVAERLKFSLRPARRDAAWTAALERCRSEPDAQFFATFVEEGQST